MATTIARRWIIPAVLFCALALPSVGSADPIVVGLPPDSDNGNCFPFGCSYSGSYQQVYTRSVFSSVFSSPIRITALEFYNTALHGEATSLTSGTWTISMSTSSADWDTLTPVFPANIGSNNTHVFTGDLARPWSFGDTLVIPFSTPFIYNPASGNLLMTIVASHPTGSDLFFDTNGLNDFQFNGNTIMGRVYLPAGGPSSIGAVNNGYGLVTGFQAQPVPEPTSLSLLVVGFAAVAVRQRRAASGRKRRKERERDHPASDTASAG